MTLPQELLATKYAGLAKKLPPSVRITGSIIEPAILVEKNNFSFSATLSGVVWRDGIRKIIKSSGFDVDWVLDGELIHPLPTDALRFFHKIFKDRDPNRLSYAEVMQLGDLLSGDIEIEIDDGVYFQGLSVAESLSEEIVVPGLDATLYPYQAKGVQFLLSTISQNGGAILADEMGLGKTMQIISLLLLLNLTNQKQALIVCPTTLIENWRREIFKFAPSISVMIHRGANRTGLSSGLQRAQVVITTYDTVVNDISIFSSIEWLLLVCDEAQAIKNPDSNRRKAVGRLCKKYAIPVTGTPVENKLLDLWSLVDFAIPNLLGSRDSFEQKFPDDEESARSLSKMTGPIVLRRTIRQVANDLPERIDVDVPLELGDHLARCYRQIRIDTLNQYPVAGSLVATGKLQLFCAHPWLQTNNFDKEEWEEDATILELEKYSLMTPKIERTVELLEEIFSEKRKVLIFSSFNRCGALLIRASKNLPRAYWGSINGSTPQQNRQVIVDEFTEYDGPGVLILNPRAAGAGLNITAATVVIHFTQVWNPALEAQASARAHRRGQTLPVTIYRLYYSETVEEVMIERSQWKRKLGNEAIPISLRDASDLQRAMRLEPSI
jgi:SNF2 family DNA or RNA helicase